MKKCFKCEVEKPVSEYYAQGKNGLHRRCKDCVKEASIKRQTELISTKDGLEKELKRHRDKYHRLNYKEKYKPSYEDKKATILRHKEKYPEKYNAKCKSSEIILLIATNEKHHWSYQEKHLKDIIELTPSFHSKLHRFIKYDKKTFMYFTKEGVLLDSREKHLEYILFVSNQP